MTFAQADPIKSAERIALVSKEKLSRRI